MGGLFALRPYRGPSDQALSLELFVSTRPDLAALPLPPPAKRSLIEQQHLARTRDYEGRFTSEGRAFMEVDGGVVGEVWVHRTKHELRLVDIAVLPARQGQGLGTRVLEDLIQEARESRLPLRLAVLRDNRARRLYERLGFRTVEPVDETALYQEMELCS